MQQNIVLITQQERLATELLTSTSKNSCKNKNKDVIQTENNNIRQGEIPAKPGLSKAIKSPLKKNPSGVIQQIETKNRHSPLETEENPTDNGKPRTDSRKTRADSPDKKVTAEQNAINITTQNIQNSNDKLKVLHRTKGSSQLLSYLVILWLRTLKAGKCQVVPAKLR